MTRILITGAGGYIGRHLTKQLLDIGYEVYALDINNKFIDSRAHFISENIFFIEEGLFKKSGAPDICIHLAWRNGFVHNSPAHMEELSSHFSFLRYMIDSGVKSIAVLGSMHEVGYWEGSITENTPCNPLTQYGIAKNSLRLALQCYLQNKKTNFFWIRAFYIYGDDSSNNSIFTKIMHAEENGQNSFPFTSGTSKYDFIHVEDLAKQISAVVSQTKITGIINCCTGIPVSLGEKVEQFIEENKYKIKLDYGAFQDRPYDSPYVWGDTQKINKIMALIPDFSLDIADGSR
jgi:Nucleoside-diphosphate-sugar epimerases